VTGRSRTKRTRIKRRDSRIRPNEIFPPDATFFAGTISTECEEPDDSFFFLDPEDSSGVVDAEMALGFG